MWWTLLSLLACSPTVEQTAGGSALVEASAPRLLRRMSLDLRGVLPSVEELDAVEADPSRLADYRDAFLADPRLTDSLVRMFAERWYTRLDEFQLEYPDVNLTEDEEFAYEKSVGEEPLRLMAHVATSDLPWSDIVTADYTSANETLAKIWPIAYPDGQTGWQVARYTDARPPAGVLATNGLWWRYVTNPSNMNRGRAAAITRLLLCQDLLSRQVSLQGAISLAGEDGAEEAIRTVPGCVNCHATVDPLAATLFGFYVTIQYNTLELTNYHAEREPAGPEYLGTQMAYFGQPVNGLADVGLAIANDSRFYSCAARTAAEALWRRPVEPADFARVESLRQDFLRGDARYSALLRAVLDTPEYRAANVSPSATDADAAREVTARLITHGQLDTALEDLSGFRWRFEGFDQMDNGNPGYRILAGGVDGYSITRPQQDPGIAWSLTIKRLAQAAADYAATHELVNRVDGPLFDAVTLDTRPDDPAFRSELARLCWRLYAIRPDEARLDALAALWSDVAMQAPPEEAWSVLVSVLLRDPDFIGY